MATKVSGLRAAAAARRSGKGLGGGIPRLKIGTASAKMAKMPSGGGKKPTRVG